MAKARKGKKKGNYYISPMALLHILSSIASILGLVLTIMWPTEPNLVYSINPNRNVLVRNTAGLKILYKGNLVLDKDVVEVNISIRNSGGLSIRKESILEPVKLIFSEKTQILEAIVTSFTREVIGLEIEENSESFHNGIANIDWRILEKGDGGNIRIIYAGKVDTDIKLAGIVEGQGELKKKDSMALNYKKLLINSMIFYPLINLWAFMLFIKKNVRGQLSNDLRKLTGFYIAVTGVYLSLVIYFYLANKIEPHSLF